MKEIRKKFQKNNYTIIDVMCLSFFYTTILNMVLLPWMSWIQSFLDQYLMI